MYVFDLKHFFPAADPSQYDRLSQPVRQRESGGDHRAGDSGNGSEYGGGGGIL